jgi:hypothetical protein
MATALVLPLRDEHDNRYPPEHWLKLAEEAWERALAFRDPEAKHQMQNIAMYYEQLAELARQRLSERKAG